MISPVWLGPAQIAGSIVAIFMCAVFTLGKDGREMKGAVREHEEGLAHCDAEVVRCEDRIEDEHQQHEGVLVAAQDIEADAAAAQATVDAHPEILAAELDAEDGLAEAVRGRLRSMFTYVDQIYANGVVVRVALATVRRFGRRYTPPAGDAAGEPYRAPDPGSNGDNGHHQLSLDQLRHFTQH